MKYGLSTRTLQELTKVFSRYPEVEEAVLYGSRAKGTYQTGSDIDVTLNGIETRRSLLHRRAGACPPPTQLKRKREQTDAKIKNRG